MNITPPASTIETFDKAAKDEPKTTAAKDEPKTTAAKDEPKTSAATRRALKRYRQRHPDRIKAARPSADKQRQYRAENRDRIRSIQVSYYRRNRVGILEKQRLRRLVQRVIKVEGHLEPAFADQCAAAGIDANRLARHIDARRQPSNIPPQAADSPQVDDIPQVDGGSQIEQIADELEIFPSLRIYDTDGIGNNAHENYRET